MDLAGSDLATGYSNRPRFGLGAGCTFLGLETGPNIGSDHYPLVLDAVFSF